MEHAGVSYFHVEHGMRPDNALRAGREICAPQRVEDAAAENDRVPVPPAVRRARDGKGSGAERSQQRRHRGGSQQRQVDWRDEDGTGTWVIGCVQAGKNRRELTRIGVRIRHEADCAWQAFELVEERAIVWPPDHEGVSSATVEERCRETRDERRFPGRNCQKRLRPAHPRGQT